MIYIQCGVEIPGKTVYYVVDGQTKERNAEDTPLWDTLFLWDGTQEGSTQPEEWLNEKVKITS